MDFRVSAETPGAELVVELIVLLHFLSAVLSPASLSTRAPVLVTPLV
jgi:hypothetical protein